MITVKDVWRGAMPDGTELLGGGGGLDRRVEWATALRTRPPAFETIKGGEMAFVPVRSIRLLDERLDLAQVIQSFGDKGGVAVAVIGEASMELVAVAERMMMPLLHLPDGSHLNDIQQTVVRFILDQRTLLHERQQELHTQLMELALAGAGTAAIVDRLAEITGHAVVWQENDGTVRHASAGADGESLRPSLEKDATRVRRWAEGIAVVAADPPVHEFALPRTGMARLVAPVPVRDGIGGFISLIAPDADLDQISRLAADLRLECSGAVAGEVSVGLGRSKPGIAGVRASYREAEQALTMGTRLFGGARVVAFSDLGLYRLLYAMNGQAELREFFEDQVQTLVEYDQRTGAGLMATLDAFFRCHGSPTEIAQLLHLHRNTVLYRLRRIEDIASLSLDDPETRLNLHLCLKVRDVLQAAS